jgi:hypothetical protein
MNEKAAAEVESTADREFVHARLIDAPRERVFEHLSGHHFRMTITFTQQGKQTLVDWRQVFDTAAERQRIAGFVAEANEQNLDRLAAEVLKMG